MRAESSCRYYSVERMCPGGNIAHSVLPELGRSLGACQVTHCETLQIEREDLTGNINRDYMRRPQYVYRTSQAG